MTHRPTSSLQAILCILFCAPFFAGCPTSDHPLGAAGERDPGGSDSSVPSETITCEQDSQTYQIGDSVALSACMTCVCQPDGTIGLCTSACAPDASVQTEPVVTCSQGGATYQIGASVALSACTTCVCQPDGTIGLCTNACPPQPAGVGATPCNTYREVPSVASETIRLDCQAPIIYEPYELRLELVDVNTDPTGGQYANIRIDYAYGPTYDGEIAKTENNGYVPNPGNYPELASADLLTYAQVMYRTHRLCTGEVGCNVWKNGKVVRSLADRYANRTCSSRYYEQCFRDGSFDVYYDERCDFGVVPFRVGEAKSTIEYKIVVGEISGCSALLTLSPKNQTVKQPSCWSSTRDQCGIWK